MTNQIIELNRCPNPSVLKRQTFRRKIELFGLLLEAVATVGILFSFLACAIVFLCIV